jgi:Bacterial Ig-like domain (group 2)
MSAATYVTAICTLAAVVSGCGGSPTAPDSTVASLTVAVPSAIGVGESVTGSALATVGFELRQVGTGWRSENPAVANVSQAGIVTGLRTGRTAITVNYGGCAASTNVRVVPEYQGRWAGTYRIAQCTPGPSDFYRQTFCGPVDRTTGNVTFTLVRTGEFVTGQFVLFGVPFPAFTVQIAEDGSIQFTSTGLGVPNGGLKTDAQFTLNSAGTGQIDGRAYWVIAGSAGLVGWGIAEGPVTAAQ